MLRAISFLLIFGLLSACSPFVTLTPPPPPQPIQVAFTATLRPWVEVFHQCALEHPEIALITKETSAIDLDFSESDLSIWFGEPSQEIPEFAFSLGTDEIVIIAGSEVAIQDLGIEQLRKLYTETDSIYQIWSYNQGNDLRSIFGKIVLEGGELSSYALLAPSPAGMIEAISADPMALGYLPKSWLSTNIQKITVDRDLLAAFEHPILVLSDTGPSDIYQPYLSCIQEKGKP